MMTRISKMVETIKHKKALFLVWKSNPCIRSEISIIRVIIHDLEKFFLIGFCGDDFATKIHRKITDHHTLSTDNGLREAVLDWEVARITKPSKPMNARQTCHKYYTHVIPQVTEICDRWGI